MNRKLIYVPLEPLKGRYTEQLARPITGWNERTWRKLGIEYERIDGPNPGVESELGLGKVINTARRCEWAFAQTTELVKRILNGSLTSSVVYFDDFWHPGLEMVQQAFDDCYYDSDDQWSAFHIETFSFCHAQSFDMYDFMRPRAGWARNIEMSYYDIYDRVFVNNDLLADLASTALNCNGRRFKNCGHPFSSEEVKEHIPQHNEPKENIVVFSSRFDKEKQPHLFMDIVEATKKLKPSIEFVVCSGGTIKSDDEGGDDNEDRPWAVERLCAMAADGIITLAENLTKAQYYHWLQRAKIQLSTSLQDWVSYCLLEALTFGCYPVYPNYRSFPETFGPFASQLYPFHPKMDKKLVVSDVSVRIRNLCDHKEILAAKRIRDHIVGHHDGAIERMAAEMGLIERDNIRG